MSWKASLHRHLGPDVGLGIPAGQECSSMQALPGHFLSRNATPARFCARKLPLLCPSFSLANVNDSGWYHDSQRAMEISEEANQQNHLVTYGQQIEPPHMDAWSISHDASGGEHNPSIHHLESRERQ
ncbi:hypothetical protein CPAR01_06162 [Colletotrichum paranaense]|uniref:Uncharacterized protein n=1 Tax=Colletotrichum paranaense TaxID=1914294 RepID=A0ABQ9STC3_9PEZI|nr:uncharacterized protein CPAR01_06162 [Colletotrichum paranaense]KAK1542775.1 hypothetical protein CPAR01_06162 [Colletotrichum paranaense]